MSNLRPFWWLILSLLIPATAGWATEGGDDFRFKRYSLEEGLSQGAVYCIEQDKRGFLWAGTQDGLNRFDGRHFVVFNHNPFDTTSLSHNRVNSLHEDREGNLWIGTAGGLNLLPAGRETFRRIPTVLQGNLDLGNAPILCLLRDRHGYLWVGRNDGLAQYNPRTGEVAHHRHDNGRENTLSGDRVLEVYEDSQGTVWVGTRNGLNRFNRSTVGFERIVLDTASGAEEGTAVSAIAEGQDGTLWLGTSAGLWALDIATGSRRHVSLNDKDGRPAGNKNARTPIKDVLVDTSGRVWIGTHDGIILFSTADQIALRLRHDHANPQSLSHSTVTRLFQDNSEVVWVGTNGYGLNSWSPYLSKFKRYAYSADGSTGLSFDSIRAIYEDPTGVVWIGGYGGGLNRLDPVTGQFSSSDEVPCGTIHTILGDPDAPEEVLWIGTDGAGLLRYSIASQTFQPCGAGSSEGQGLVGRHIYSMCADEAGRLLIGTERGVNVLDRASGEFSTLDCYPGGSSIRAIEIDRSGTLWVGASGGLARLDPGARDFIHYVHDPTDPYSLSINSVLCVYEGTSAGLWIGTDGGGLSKLDRFHNTFVHYLQEDGLPNNVVYGILEDDDGRLWISTNSGISRFDPQSETFYNYGLDDGLQSLEFNANAHHKGPSGNLYFGGISGLNVIKPDEMRTDPHPPKVAITDLLLSNRSVPPFGTVNGRRVLTKPISETHRLELFHRDKIISFELAALSFASPTRNRFAYKLEGFDEEWNNIGSRQFVTFTDLKPGEYHLLVKAANSDGVWSSATTSLTISISPPIWQAWWFRCLAVIAFGSVIFGLHRIRTGTYRRRSAGLDRSRDFLNSIINALDDPVFVKDDRHRWVVLNDKSCEMMARPREDLLMKTDYDVFPEEQAESLWKKDDEAFTKHGTVINEDVIGWRGNTRIISTKKSAFTERATGKRFIAGAIRDITELKHYEKALEERLHFESLVSRISAQLINPPVSDIDRVIEDGLKQIGRFFAADRVVIRLARGDRDLPAKAYTWSFDSSSASHIRQDFEAAFPNLAEELRRDREVVFEKIDDIPAAWRPEHEHLTCIGVTSGVVVPLSVGGSLLGSISVLMAGGERTWAQNTTARIRILGETLANALNRKRAEEALRQSQQKYWSILENIGIGIALISNDLKLLEVNKKMREWLPGLRDHDIPFCDRSKDGPAREHDCVDCLIRRTLHDGCVHETQMANANGAGLPNFRAITSPIRNSDGDVVAVIELVEDVTEKQQLEEQLRHAQKMEAIGTLAGGIAHDFNNILHALLGYTNLAKSDVPEDSSVQDYLGQIEIAGRRAAELVQQILAFSRRGESRDKSLRLQKVVVEALKLLRGSLPTTVEIRLDIADDCGPVLANPIQIHQIVINLCTNAFQAMPNHKGLIELSLREVVADQDLTSRVHDLEPGVYARLTVQDDGSGIEPEVLKRICEPYFTTKGHGEGSGLGLAMVHGIIKSHGGAIHIDSKPGRGTTFDIYLPICGSQDRESKSHLPIGDSVSLNARILLVDDESIIAEMSENVLRKLGHQVTIFTDSIEALAAFRANPNEFDLVITDVTMPKLTGLELAEEIRATRKDIPLILCTGYSESLDSNSLKGLNIQKCIWKPVDIDDLAKTIQEVLSASEAVEV